MERGGGDKEKEIREKKFEKIFLSWLEERKG